MTLLRLLACVCTAVTMDSVMITCSRDPCWQSCDCKTTCIAWNMLLVSSDAKCNHVCLSTCHDSNACNTDVITPVFIGCHCSQGKQLRPALLLVPEGDMLWVMCLRLTQFMKVIHRSRTFRHLYPPDSKNRGSATNPSRTAMFVETAGLPNFVSEVSNDAIAHFRDCDVGRHKVAACQSHGEFCDKSFVLCR